MLARLKLSTAVKPASASARSMARPISPRPNTATGASRGTSAMRCTTSACTPPVRPCGRMRRARPNNSPTPRQATCRLRHTVPASCARSKERSTWLPMACSPCATESSPAATRSSPPTAAAPWRTRGRRLIGILGRTDQRGAEQLRGPRRPRRGQQPLDARATLDAHHAGDLRRPRAAGCAGPSLPESRPPAPRAPRRAPRDNSCRPVRAGSRSPQRNSAAVSTSAATVSGGVPGRMPCPRLRMQCRPPEVRFMVSSRCTRALADHVGAA